MKKEKLSSARAKTEFVQSIHRWLMKTLEERGHEDCKNCFTVEGSSIMCELPTFFFDRYEIPENTKIEMKFVLKKS